MAGLYVTAASGELSVPANIAKTLVAVVAPPNQRRRIVGWKIMAKGNNPNQAPIRGELIVGLSPGSMGGGGQMVLTNAIKRNTTDQETPTSLVYVNQNVSTTEPTGTIAATNSEETPAAGGAWEVRLAVADQPMLGGNTACGLRVTPDTVTIMAAEIYLEE